MLLLPLAAFVLLWVLISGHRQVIGFTELSRRGVLLLAFLAFEAILLVITEVTSIGSHFTAGVVASAWGVVVLVLAVASRSSAAQLIRRQGSPGECWRRLTTAFRRLGIDDRLWLAALIVFLAVMVVLASMYLPSNSDSMVYHLARVEHWIQNRTIAPFATHYTALVDFPPLDEYNLATLHLLSGTDRFDAVVDLFATLICVVGSSELARLLGAKRSVQIVAAVVCATIPTGVLLATSTDNDPMAAALGIALLVVAVSLSIDRGPLWQAVILGVSGGLAYLAKSTLLLLLGPAVIVLVALAVRRFVRMADRRTVVVGCWRFGAVAVVCGLAVIVPFVGQTYHRFDSLVGPTTSQEKSSKLTVEAGAANVIRTTANNFHIGNGTSGFNTVVAKVVLGGLKRAYDLFHIAESDPRYSTTVTQRAFVVANYGRFNLYEAGGANPWTVILLILSLIVLLVAAIRGVPSLRRPALLGVALVAGYLLFAFVDKWGLYNARYGLPLLVAWSALIAIALAQFRRWVAWVVVGALVLACLPQLINSESRPLEKPARYSSSYLEPYFISCCRYAATLAVAYETITADLAQSTCTRASMANWVLDEYPLWTGLAHDGWKGLLDDTDIPTYNRTRSLEPKWTPCATITQQGVGYRTPDNGTVNLQLADLALSVDAGRATTMRTPVPRFTSSVAGVRVWPGGGWLLRAYGGLPVLEDHGTIYIASGTVRSVQLRLLLPATVTQPAPSIVGPNGRPLPSTVLDHTIRADLTLHAGMNRVTLELPRPSRIRRSTLLLRAVTVAPR